MSKKILVVIGGRGIGDLIYHLPLLKSLYQSYKCQISILSNKVNKAKEVFKNEKFFKEIIEFDNNRLNFYNTIKKIYSFKKLIDKFEADKVILTSNATRLVIPVLLSNCKRKHIFGLNKYLFFKDKSLNHMTLSEKILFYTNSLKLSNKSNSFNLKSIKKKNNYKKKIFISVDSHHDQNNWDIKNYIILIKKLFKKNKIYINFSPNKKFFLNYFPKNLKSSKNIEFTYKKKISEIIGIINSCDHIIGNESGPICLAASLKKKVHAIYIPIHTKPESKIINEKNHYYNTHKLSSNVIIKKIIKSL